jgi:hypothetical protein
MSNSLLVDQNVLHLVSTSKSSTLITLPVKVGFSIYVEFQKTDHIHAYFDVESFPFDFKSDKKKKDEGKKVEIDGKIGTDLCNYFRQEQK